MNSQSDLRLGGTMLLVATLICGGFAVAALYPVVKQTTWRKIFSSPAASTADVSNPSEVITAEHPTEQEIARQQADEKQRYRQAMAQKRRLAEQELVRKRAMRQQAAQRYAARRTQTASHRRQVGTVSSAADGQRTIHTIPRQATRGTVQNHAVSDVQRNEVNVPVNVHPVTVNVDGSTMSGEVARLADGINQVLTAQREALRAQEQQHQPVIVQAVPHQMIQPVEAAATVSREEKERLEKIDATLQALAGSFESLRSETRSAVAGISQNVTQAQTSHAEVTARLLAEYRQAIDQQRELLRYHEEDVTARIRLDSLSDRSVETVAADETTMETPATSVPPPKPVPVPAEFEEFEEFKAAEFFDEEILDEEPLEVVPTEQPTFEEPVVEEEVAEFFDEEILDEEPLEVVPTEQPAFEEPVVEEVFVEPSIVAEAAEFFPEPREPTLMIPEEREVAFAAEEQVIDVVTVESDADELESWIEEQAAPQTIPEEIITEVVREDIDLWDLENPFDETDEDADFESFVENSYRAQQPIARAHVTHNTAQQRRVQSVAYEKTYRFPIPSVEQSVSRVQNSAVGRAGCQVCNETRPRHSVQAQYQQRPPAGRSQRATTRRPVIQQTAAQRPATQQPVPRRPGMMAEFGQNIRHGAGEIARGIGGSNPRVGRSPQDTGTGSHLMHRVKSAFRQVGSGRTVE